MPAVRRRTAWKPLPLISSLLLGSLQPLEGGAVLRGCLTKVTTWGHCDFAQSRMSTIWPRPRAHCLTPPPQRSLQGIEGLALGPELVPWHVRECRQGEVNVKCLGQR